MAALAASPSTLTSCLHARQAVRSPTGAAAQWRPSGAWRRRRQAALARAAQQQQELRLPDFVPAEQAEEIEEPAARAMLAAMQRVRLDVPGFGEADTAFVGPERRTPGRPAFVLLHGFDSSCLEFRCA